MSSLPSDQQRFEPATFWVVSERSTVMPHRLLSVSQPINAHRHTWSSQNNSVDTEKEKFSNK